MRFKFNIKTAPVPNELRRFYYFAWLPTEIFPGMWIWLEKYGTNERYELISTDPTSKAWRWVEKERFLI